jgi:uncharacterized protein with NRDE domain
MCLLAIAFQSHPDASLIVTSNRDEFYARPTLPMHWWSDAPILAGRDAQAGGTWIGLSRRGRFAAVTNFRQITKDTKSPPTLLSRGQLISDFLTSDQNVDEWAKALKPAMADYGGFNLLLYDGFNLLYLNNHDNSEILLPPGIYALSNHLLDSPWPKVDHARDQLKQAITADTIGAEQLPDLIACLSLEKTFPPELLPNTGVPEHWEQLLSSPFIVADGYGTRASAAIIMRRSGEVDVAEHCFEAGASLGYQEFSFNLSAF